MHVHYIVDDRDNLIEFEEVGEHNNGSTKELRIKGSTNNQVYVFNATDLRPTIKEAYEVAFARALENQTIAKRNCTRAKNQFDKAVFKCQDLLEKIESL